MFLEVVLKVGSFKFQAVFRLFSKLDRLIFGRFSECFSELNRLIFSEPDSPGSFAERFSEA